MKRCLVCNGKGYAKGLCRKHYYQRPEVKEQQREYRQRPEVKEQQREYQQRPEVKEQQWEYRQRPEVKEQQREYRQRPEVKEHRREYRQRPERAERALLLARISELRKKISELKERKRRSFVLEERLACYERAFELNFIDNKFKAGNPVIPKCAINAGKKELWGDKE